MAWPLGRRAADTGAQAEAQPETISCKAKVAITNTDLDAERAPGGLIKCPVQQAESCRHDDGPGSHATSAMTNGCMQVCHLCSWRCKAGQAGSQNYACTAPELLFCAPGLQHYVCVGVMTRLTPLISGTRTFVHLQNRG